ncbi:hypothetical protein [Massilia psychrophila]|jgi:hypothetical protein|uniref:Uncharacterized protein n=1 Tax=Massilia psychrophila TaxID=1603353 RepID=A0A2G8T3J9_9BURK|nr:hypothetical protein [Massilia psychrophila]PIL40611.1 hypothetical protein CR103_06840 [Massilia psychrophila]GGE74696.1 hypothetical protein GCM10008020_19230 [Massilia psychrophila]
MPSITIRDLQRSTELDQHAMCAVRGGFAFQPDAHVNVNVSQQIFQVQQIGVNVLNNNGSIGAGFVGPNIDLDVMLKASNNASIPKLV